MDLSKCIYRAIHAFDDDDTFLFVLDEWDKNHPEPEDDEEDEE